MEIEYFQTIRKRDFAEILQNFLTAGHLLFSRPFPAAGHIAIANKFRQINTGSCDSGNFACRLMWNAVFLKASHIQLQLMPQRK